jgi:hypothetical protein
LVGSQTLRPCTRAGRLGKLAERPAVFGRELQRIPRTQTGYPHAHQGDPLPLKNEKLERDSTVPEV